MCDAMFFYAIDREDAMGNLPVTPEWAVGLEKEQVDRSKRDGVRQFGAPDTRGKDETPESAH